jgi:tetratricopeptide (TPR) repeat protein/predicted Ser/Thr protein kinase
MTQDQTLAELFAAACGLHGQQRQDYLDAHCAGDAELRRQVEQLLALDADSGFLGEAALARLRTTALARADAPMPSQVGPFRIEAVLGRGGMGVVYRARQTEPDRAVALKVLGPGLGSEVARARLQTEAAALARLQHPGIAQIYAAGTWGSPIGPQPYLAMELVEGETLRAWAARRSPPLRRRIELLIELCRAVHFAHQKGIVHRDLKPGNVLVDAAGRPRVLDFGIARFVDGDGERASHTLTGQVLGTLAYMSPEQAEGRTDAIDIRSDVYSLGVLGYELLAGRLPIDVVADPITVGLRRLSEEAPRPLGEQDRGLRGDVQTIFAMALRKEPERRYDSALALADDLERWLAHQPIRARPATPWYVTRRFAQRHRGLVAGTAFGLAALVAGAIAALAWALRASAAEARASDEARVANRAISFVESLFHAAAPRASLGATVTARDVVAAGRASIEREFADEPAIRLRLSRLLGLILIELGDFANADPLLADTVATLQARGADADELARALSGAARAKMMLGRLEDAKALYGDALAACERLGQSDSLLAGRCLAGLAQVAREQRDFPVAMQCFARARELVDRHGSARDRADLLVQVAVAHQLQRQLDEAVALFAEVEALVPVEQDPLFAGLVATNLGNLRVAQQRFDAAEPLFERALALGERYLGSTHPQLIRRLCNLASVYGSTDRVALAEPLLERAVSLATNIDGSHDDSVAVALQGLGNVRGMQGRADEALALWERALEIHVRRGAKGHRDQLRVLENMAKLLEMRGDAEAAARVRARMATLQSAK